MQHRIRILRVRTIVWLAVLVAIPALPGTAMAQSATTEARGFALTPQLLTQASWHGRPIQRPLARRFDVADGGARLRPGAGYRRAGGSRRVRDVQRRLIRLGYRPGPRDGLFGPRTQAAVLAFQRKHGLEQSGVVGPATLHILRRRTTVTAERPQEPADSTAKPTTTQPQAPPVTPARSTGGGAPALLIVALALLAIPLVLLAGLLLHDRRRVVVELPPEDITPWSLSPPWEPRQLPEPDPEPLFEPRYPEPDPEPLFEPRYPEPEQPSEARAEPPPRTPPPEPEKPRIRRTHPPRHGPSQERRQELRERILEMRAEGMTLQEIADRLTGEGEMTPGGGRLWQPWTVRAATRPIDPGRGRVPQRRHGKP